MPDTNYYIMQKYNRTGHQFADGDLVDAVACSMERPEFPFEGDVSNFLLHQEYYQYIDWYLEKVPTPGTPNPKYPDLYFLHDTPIQDMGGGVGKFTRTWGLMPGFNGERIGSGSVFVRKESESFVWTKPGVNTVDSVYTTYFIDTVASVPTQTATSIKLYTTMNIPAGARWPHNVNTDYNTVSIGYYIQDPVSLRWKYFTNTSTIISRGTDYVEVAPVAYYDAGVLNPIWYLWFSRPIVKINPTQKVISTFRYIDYYLPGLNCDSPEDIPIIQQWKILDENLNETDTLTTATTPTMAQYNTMVAAGTLVCVEPSVIRRWQGNVWERTTRYGYLI